MLRRMVVFALVAIVGMGLAAGASAQKPSEFVVIVNQQNSVGSVSREFLTDAFLKKASHWDGGEIIHPADQRPNASVRVAFSARVLLRTIGAVRSYWQQRIFSGGELPPPELDSDDDVVRYVTKYSGGVGYVSPSARLGGTKAVVVQ